MELPILPIIRKTALLFLLPVCFSCDEYLDVNDTQNRIVEVPSGTLLLKGTLLANAQVQQGHLARAAMYYSGGLRGVQLVQQTIYNYDYTPGESNAVWSHAYNGILVQNKEIRRISPELDRLQGIIDVNEALAVGTLASLFGDVPYSTAVPDNPGANSPDPTFDPQAYVYDSLQQVLDSAIEKLKTSKVAVGDEDIYYNGDQNKWIQAAYTLKARYYLQTKNYTEALANAKEGISSPENTMNFVPIGSVNGNSNLIYLLVTSSRAGDMTADGSFFRDSLMAPGTPYSRDNAKTNEEARRAYLYISGNEAQANGIDGQATPMQLVSYEENLLIWAECLLRDGKSPEALGKLNELRAYLRSGQAFNLINEDDVFEYEDYEMADFDSGGMENPRNTALIAPNRALLREIIQERYVSCYTTYIPFNDARRLRRASDSDVMVPFPLNTSDATVNPQRLLYPQTVINANSNTPDPIPGLFDPTPVNQ